MKQFNTAEFLNLSEQYCIQIQYKLSSKVIQSNSISLENIKTVAGVDIAYWKENNKEMAVCCVIVIDFNTKQVVEKQHFIGEVKFPYISGCLAFRELPLIMQTVIKLK